MNMPLFSSVISSCALLGKAGVTLCVLEAGPNSRLPTFLAGEKEQRYLTAQVALAALATISTLWIANGRSFSSGFPFMVVSGLVGGGVVAQVYREQMIPPAERRTWSQITVNSCDLLECFAGKEVLSQLFSTEFVTQMINPNALTANSNKVEINLVDLVSKLTVSLLPLAAMTMLAVRHAGYFCKTIASGSLSLTLIQDMAAILPWLIHLGTHGVVIPFLQDQKTGTVRVSLDHYVDSQGPLVNSELCKGIHKLALMAEPYGDIILPFFHIYFGNWLLKVISLFGLVLSHAPEEALDAVLIALEQQFFNFCSFVYTLALTLDDVDIHAVGSEDIPPMVHRAWSVVMSFVDSVILIPRHQTRQSGKTARTMVEAQSVQNPDSLSATAKTEALLDIMRRGDTLAPPPSTASTSSVGGFNMDFPLSEMLGSFRKKILEAVAELVKRGTVTDANMGLAWLGAAMNTARVTINKPCGLALPPWLRYNRALLADPDAVFKYTSPPNEVHVTFKKLQERATAAINSGTYTFPAWFQTSILDGKLLARLDRVCLAYPDDTEKLTRALNAFFYALDTNIATNESFIQDYIENNNYLSESLVIEMCNEQGLDLFKKLGLLGTAVLSGTKPITMNFILDTLFDLEGKKLALFAEGHRLAALLFGTVADSIRVADQSYKNGPPIRFMDDPFNMRAFSSMGARYGANLSREKATNVHEFLEASGDRRVFGQGDDPTKEAMKHRLQSELAFDIPAWLLEILHGPRDLITYEKLLTSGFGEAFTRALLPNEVRAYYSVNDQARLLEIALMVREFELMIPTHTHNGVNKDLERDLRERVEHVKHELALALADGDLTPLNPAKPNTPLLAFDLQTTYAAKPVAPVDMGPVEDLVDMRPVEDLLDRINRNDNVASSAALFFRLSQMDAAITVMREDERNLNQPVCFKTLSPQAWHALGQDEVTKKLLDQSYDTLEAVIAECPSNKDWKNRDPNPLTWVSEVLQDFVIDAIVDSGNQDYHIWTTLKDFILQHPGCDILKLSQFRDLDAPRQALEAAQQENATLEQDQEIGRIEDQMALLGDSAYFAQFNNNKQLATLEKVFSKSLRWVVEDHLIPCIPAECEGATLLEMFTLHEAYEKEAYVWRAAFEKQHRALKQRFDTQLGAAAMVALDLVTPINAPAPINVPLEQSHALQNVAAMSAPISREGMAFAPEMYRNLLTGKLEQYFTFSSPLLSLSTEVKEGITTALEEVINTVIRETDAFKHAIGKLVEQPSEELVKQARAQREQADDAGASVTEGRPTTLTTQIRLPAHEVRSIMRELAPVFEKFSPVMRYAIGINGWQQMCSVLNDGYTSKPVVVKASYHIKDQTLDLPKQDVGCFIPPKETFPGEALVQSTRAGALQAIRAHEMESYGMTPPVAVTKAQAYRGAYDITGMQPFLDLANRSQHPIDKTAEIEETIQKLRDEVASGDQSDPDAFKQRVDRLMAQLGPSFMDSAMELMPLAQDVWKMVQESVK